MTGSATDGPYADVDVTTLTQKEASDYRQELYNVFFYAPGIEIEVLAQGSDADKAFYEKKLKEVDAYLLTFTEKI
jgi:hypothetical protein